VISGKSHGTESPVRPLGGCWYFHVKFKQPGKIFQTLRKDPFPNIPDSDLSLNLVLLAAGWTSFIYSMYRPRCVYDFELRIACSHEWQDYHRRFERNA
jgi:hypothetical protein